MNELRAQSRHPRHFFYLDRIHPVQVASKPQSASMMWTRWLTGGLVAAAGVIVKLAPSVGLVEERVVVAGSVDQVYDFLADFSNTQRQVSLNRNGTSTRLDNLRNV